MSRHQNARDKSFAIKISYIYVEDVKFVCLETAVRNQIAFTKLFRMDLMQGMLQCRIVCVLVFHAGKR
jgi:hypothetical protein